MYYSILTTFIKNTEEKRIRQQQAVALGYRGKNDGKGNFNLKKRD